MATFREKKTAYDGMRGRQFFEPDMQLLREKLPDHELCKRKYLNEQKHQAEALWALLDVVSKDEIVLNRRKYFKQKDQAKLDTAVTEVRKLLETLATSSNLTELKAACITIKEKAEPLPAEIKDPILQTVEEVYADLSGKLDPEKQKAAELVALNKELLTVDLENTPQKDLADYTRRLIASIKSVPPKDMKAVTLRPWLAEYVANLPREESQKPEAGSQKLEEENQELKAENEELQKELDDKTNEANDLEEENEELKEDKQELQQQNEKLEEQLEAEKKSEHPAPKSSKNMKSTPISSGGDSK